jgi:beta-lactamase class C
MYTGTSGRDDGTRNAMKARTLRNALLALMLAPSALLAAGQAPVFSVAAEFDDWFRDLAMQENLVGAAFAIVSREQIVRIGTHGYTDTTREHLIDADTAFRLASVSKTFAAGLAAQLVRDGLFRWDDPVTRYVPDFRIKGDSAGIRIEHLLGQSSGLIPHAYDNLIEDGMPVEAIEPQAGANWRQPALRAGAIRIRTRYSA